MSEVDSEFARRSALTFKQAEGVVPLPQQLKTGEISDGFRAALYETFHSKIEYGHGGLAGDLFMAYRRYWVDELNLPITDIPNRTERLAKSLEALCFKSPAREVLEFCQYCLRLEGAPPNELSRRIEFLLKRHNLAYRVRRMKGFRTTLMPIASEESAAATAQNLATISTIGGATAHAQAAVAALSRQSWADAARESIHMVEAVARNLSGDDSADLGKALAILERRAALHPALKSAIVKLYGYTSDEKGVRHSLVEEMSADIDEALALFLFSSCAAFAALLVQRSSP